MTALEATLHDAGEPDDPRLPVPLALLTDEELVALGGEHPVVVLPHYERLSPGAQEVAVATARRCLAARGARSGPPDGPGSGWVRAGGDHQLPVSPEVSDLLDVRDGAGCVLVLRRRCAVPDGSGTGGGPDAIETVRYAHLVEDFVLLEDVDPQGRHQFWAADADVLTQTVAAFVHHPDLRDSVGGAVRLEPPGDVLLTVDATVWRRGPQHAPVLLGMLLGRDGSWVTRTVYGARGPAVLQPVAVADLGALVAALVEDVRMGR